MNFQWKVFFKVCLTAIFCIALPLNTLALDRQPILKKFSVDGNQIVSGATFTLTLVYATDVIDYEDIDLTLEDIPLTITSKASNLIKGTLPENVPLSGGRLYFHYEGKTASTTIKAPVITNVTYSDEELSSDTEISISGVNFEKDATTVSLGSSNLTITKSSNSQVVVSLNKNSNPGKLIVKAHGFVSPSEDIEFEVPHIDLIRAPDGFGLGSEIMIFGSGFPKHNKVMFGSDELKITQTAFDPSYLKVELPEKNIQESLWIESNGFVSNKVTVSIFETPVVKSYKVTEEDGIKNITIKGLNFSPSTSENSVQINGKSISVQSASESEIIARLSSSVTEGCLSVTTNGKISNCYYFNSADPPIILKSYRIPTFIPDAVDNPIYEWKIYADNVPEKKQDISVSISGTTAEVDRVWGGVVVAHTTLLPEKGKISLTANGIKSNTLNYDFGRLFYPSINQIEAPNGFMADRKVNFNGVGFGRLAQREYLNVSLNNGTLVSEDDWVITPLKISMRTNDDVEEGKETTMSLTFQGRKSNEITFTAAENIQRITRDPWLHSIQYPNGIQIGETVEIFGNGFDAEGIFNQVYFGEVLADIGTTSSAKFTVKIPEGIPETGKLKVIVDGRESNEIDYMASPVVEVPFDFLFDDTSPSAPVAIDEKITVAKLKIKNLLGDVMISRLEIMMEYDDNSAHPDSFENIHRLPFGEFEMTSDIPNFYAKPAVLRKASDGYSIVFENLNIPSNLEEQIIDIKTIVRGFSLDGTKFNLKIDDISSYNYNAVYFHNDSFGPMNLKKPAITSPIFTVSNKIDTCIDAEGDDDCLVEAEEAPTDVILTEATEEPEVISVDPEVGVGEEIVEIESKPKLPNPSLMEIMNVRDLIAKRDRKQLDKPWLEKKRPLIPFRDIENSDESKFIHELKRRGIVQGRGNNEYSPLSSVTRAEFLKMVIAGLQCDTSVSSSKAEDMSDIDTSDWYFPYVSWAVDFGIVKGYSDNTFKPHNHISRAEALKIIMVAGAFNLSKITHGYTDTDTWQNVYVSEAIEREILTDGTHLRPNEPINRAEAAKLIALMLEAYEGEVGNSAQ